MSDSFLLKMEVVNEYKRAARLIKANKEIGEIFLSTLRWLDERGETNHIPLDVPQERIRKAVERMESLLAESEECYHRDDSAKKLPEPDTSRYAYIRLEGVASL
jgi:hypothetical protein